MRRSARRRTSRRFEDASKAAARLRGPKKLHAMKSPFVPLAATTAPPALAHEGQDPGKDEPKRKEAKQGAREIPPGPTPASYQAGSPAHVRALEMLARPLQVNPTLTRR